MLNKNNIIMKKFFIFLVSLLFLFPFVQNSNAQKCSLSKANNYYINLNYSKAIPLYERVLKKSQGDFETMTKLADCYRLTNNTDKASDLYARIVDLPDIPPINKYYYAQTLLSKGEYQKAAEYFKKYQEVSRDPYVKSINNLSNYFKDSANYKITKVSFNSKNNDFSPALLENQKIVFVSSRPESRLVNYTHGWTGYSFTHLLYTEKNKKNKYKNPKMFSRKIQSRFNEGPMCFSSDMNIMYFTRNAIFNNKTLKGDDGKVKLQICQATYYKNQKKFKNAVEFEHNNINYNYAHPALSPDGKYLYFSSDRPGGYGGMDLWMCERQDNHWSSPVNLGNKINTPGNEVFPFIQGTDRIYFSSDGLCGLGGLDIFTARLDPHTGKPSGKTYNMGANLNSRADDFGICFRADGKSGFLSSNRNGEGLNDDIYEFTIINPVNFSILIKGKTIDKQTGKPISGAKIKLLNEKGETVEQILSDENGNYIFEAEFDHNYQLIGEKDKNYKPVNNSVSTHNSKNKNEIISDIYFEIIPPAKLTISLINSKSKQAVEGVKIILTDKQTNEISEYYTNEKGMINIPLNKKAGDQFTYSINFTHNEYLPKTVDVSQTIAPSGEISLKEEIFKIELGQDVGKALNLNPIYFDYDKFDIRPDAQIELDKIVTIMNEYPNMVIELGSHTDCRGKASYNLNLSDKRAKASASYIISKGIDKSRIYGKGYGESKLINNCKCEGKNVTPCTEEEHQINRRTEFIIVKK